MLTAGALLISLSVLSVLGEDPTVVDNSVCKKLSTVDLCAPTDCYEENGETYRGAVNITEGGEECLDWRSPFIAEHGDDPFTTYSDFDGLENNHCRNPDGDAKPWCFFKQQDKLQWDYCHVKRCSEATEAPPVSPLPGSVPFSQCGISNPSRRIYGGSKAVPGAHPWQVSLQARTKGSEDSFRHICGGILLSSCWVLTAGHCIKTTREYRVVLGKVNLDKHEATEQTIPVIQMIVHENYTENSAPENDFALLHLSVTNHPYCAKENRFVRTVCLPDQAFPDGKECVISGWGRTEDNTPSRQLLDARVVLISDERCKVPLNVYGDLLDNSMICAGNLKGGIGSCKGDSGGPLVCERNGTHYITGVVSWGIGCLPKVTPDIYANVFPYAGWIESKINRTFY